MHVSKTLAVLAGLLCVPLTDIHASDITDFGPGTQVGRIATAPELSGNNARFYRQWVRDAGYFGALAYNPNTDDLFFVTNFHSASTARASALEGCAQVSQEPGCVLFAVAMPESIAINRANADGLGAAASDDFNTVYPEGQIAGEYGAFAISRAGNHGFAWGWDTEAEATDTALAFCMQGVATDMAAIGPQGRAYARANGLNTCRIVHVHPPDGG